MKITFVSLCILFTSISVLAQQQESFSPSAKKFYVGVDFNVTPYYLNYNSRQPLWTTNFTPYPGLHVGYQLSKRARIQIGAAYGTNNYYQRAITYNNNGVLQGDYEDVSTKGFIVPISLRYDFLNVNKRFQAYGFATLTSVYAHTTLKSSTTREGVVTDSHKTSQSAVGLFLGVGIGASYRLNNRISVFGEYSFVNRNLAGGWVPNRRGLDIGLLNLGLNYKFQ